MNLNDYINKLPQSEQDGIAKRALELKAEADGNNMMKYNRVFLFSTKEKADGFVMGVTYVNDSSLEVAGIEERSENHWAVLINDNDDDDQVEEVDNRD